MTRVRIPPSFTNISCIYPGPHMGADGKIENRIFFYIKSGVNNDGELKYLIFPHGAKDEEIVEYE